MARPLRLEYAGALYHLTSRGNAQNDIFCDDADRNMFLLVLASTIAHFGWQLHAYCLMGNHYHLLAATPKANLSRSMARLNGAYTQYFNRRHARVGHVLQGRFKAIVVERESYLLELARYIPLNPVRSGLVPSVEQWHWSSYRAHAGLESPPSWLQMAPVLERFSEDTARAAQHYRQFVHAGVALSSPWSQLRGQILLGTDQFAERLRTTLAQQAISSEVPRAERFATRPTLKTVLPPAQLGHRVKRNAAILEAYRIHGYSLAAIARHTGLHYSTVSRIAKDGMQQFKT